MTATYAQARDAMMDLLNTAWAAGASTYPILWDDRVGNPDPSKKAWARVFIRHNQGDQETLSNPIGTRLFRRDGIINVQIFTATGDGLKTSDALAKIVADAYEGKATSNGVWFKNVRLRENGVDGNWYQVNVLIDFEYNEAK